MSVLRRVDPGDDDTVPDNLKQLRACMVCSLVKTLQQFVGKDHGDDEDDS